MYNTPNFINGNIFCFNKKYMLDATGLPRGSAVRCNIVATYSTLQQNFKSHSTYLLR